MTKKQEKAIKVLEQYKRECIEEYKVELDDKDNIDQPRAFYLHQQIESVYIVLNMLKEKDTEIQKKDKIIDLMAEQLIGLPVNKIKQDFEKPNFKAEITIFTDKEAIKQYFERKVKQSSDINITSEEN